MITRILLVITLLASAVCTALFVHVDFYPRLATYGYSVGTDNDYCSFELVNWHPVMGCQTQNASLDVAPFHVRWQFQ